MIPDSYDHDGVHLAGRYIRYAVLERDWRCNVCAGRIVTQCGDGGWHAKCGRCGGRDFIHEWELARQQALAEEVLDGLPPELAALVR